MNTICRSQDAQAIFDFSPMFSSIYGVTELMASLILCRISGMSPCLQHIILSPTSWSSGRESKMPSTPSLVTDAGEHLAEKSNIAWTSYERQMVVM